MAYAGAEFAAKILRALNGEKGLVAPSFVNLASDPAGGEALKKEIGKDLDYFSAPIELGPEGVVKINSLGKLTDFEKGLVQAAVPELEGNIDKGVAFIQSPKL
ncbi:Malate dehydrogenase, cytoplasmic [Grifola frondosa]|uniref:Malate dehydrogenase, cytoplasmic n=1 Tax=Grifola frondosa TaxID=5627 RepID=A0A1C7MGF9_GRIFR|nr:Malate dehydrogenase, cytoplasmic [Grifola frondosa]